jgi:putative transposase
MAKAPAPFTSLSEEQRAEAYARFEMLRPVLEEGVSQAQIVRTHQLSRSAVQRRVKRYREQRFAGLVTDKGKSRRLPDQAIILVEGLALQTPPRSAAAIRRQVVEIAKAQGWKPPGYQRVRRMIKNLDPALVTLAHQGAATYREEFDGVYRREATHANTMWQADHPPLDVWLLDEAGNPAKPYLTAIEDDYSRLIVGYRLSFQVATALTTALTLRHAIWRKDDPRWSASGIPSIFYTDHGSDFTSKHMEQVAADIGMELVFSEKGVPHGCGKVERFFRSVDQLFLQEVPGYAPKGYGEAEAILTLAAFEQRCRTWLLEDSHQRVHSETACQPKDHWEKGGFVSRMPASLEQFDLLLLTAAKTRKVQQDGIHFQNHRYMDINLVAFLKEEVVIRYNPADLGRVHAFYQLCRYVPEGSTVARSSLKPGMTRIGLVALLKGGSACRMMGSSHSFPVQNVSTYYQDRFLCRAMCAELGDRKGEIRASQAGSSGAPYASGSG